ncbi:MAG TPA: LytR C-terminal domain-containing protein, partial [Anaerolineaceae bacterium]
VNFNMLPTLVSKAPKLYEEIASGVSTNLTLDQIIQLAYLASKVDRSNIKQGVFDPHKDVAYASVVTSDGQADVLVPNPDQIRILRDQIFVNAGQIGPSTVVTDPVERVKAENARVLLRAGNSKPELFQQAGSLLQSLNIQIAGTDNAGQIYANTTFIDHSGKPYTINYLIEKMGVPQSRIKIDFKPGSAADLEVIVGEDFTGGAK